MAYDSASFTTLQHTAFESTLYHLVEVKRSVLAATVGEMKMEKGRPNVVIKRVDKMAAAAERTTAWQDLTVTPLSFDSVMITPKTYSVNVGFDSLDLAKSDLANPAGLAADKISATFARQIDDTLFAALVGTTATGNDGAGTETLGASETIISVESVGVPTAGLTADVIDDALESMALAGVDLDMTPLFCVMSPKGTKSMYKNRSTFASLELGRTIDQVNGQIGTYRKIRFLESNSVTDISGTESRAVLYTGRVLARAANKELAMDVDKAAWKDGIGHVLVKAEHSIGAARLHVDEVRDIRFKPGV